MSSTATQKDVFRLMTTFNMEIRALPDDLKCAECKSVLKDACQAPCGCRFCRACIDGLMARGGQFCPGGSQECGRTPLSIVQRDYRANNSIMKLTAKCPHAGCTHECSLADMEGHLRVCPRKSVDCPFRELGCPHGGLAAADMSSHMQQESGSHSEILIGLVAGIKRDMEMLKRGMRDELTEQVRHVENEIKLIKDENKLIKDENKLIKDENKSIKDENKSIKDENKSIKDENKSIKDEIKCIKDENKSIKDENKSIKDENKSIKDENKSIKDENNSIKDEFRSIKSDFDSVKLQIQYTRVVVGLERGDASCDNWLIDADLAKVEWGWNCDVKTNPIFTGTRRPYTYQLASYNDVSGGELRIYLCILAGKNDSQLEWPFTGAVAINVAHMDKREACSRHMRLCQIKRPQGDGDCSWSDVFQFSHAQLKEAGLVLCRGVRVSCQIAFDAAQ